MLFVVGCWLVVGRDSFVGYWLLAIGYWLLAIFDGLFLIGGWLFASTGRSIRADILLLEF
jgi:hypothetical protein